MSSKQMGILCTAWRATLCWTSARVKPETRVETEAASSFAAALTNQLKEGDDGLDHNHGQSTYELNMEGGPPGYNSTGEVLCAGDRRDIP